MSSLIPITIKQADVEGRIRDVEVMVVPQTKRELIVPFLPFGKKHRALVAAKEHRAAVKQQALELIAQMYAAKKEDAEAALHDATAGEKELVLKKIDGEHRYDSQLIERRKYRTNELLIKYFSSEGAEAILRLQEVMDGTKYLSNEIKIRERIVFHDEIVESYGSIVEPCIDNLRTCHSLFARQDLSELEGEDLDLARKLLVMSVQRHDKEREKIDNRSSYKDSEWVKARSEAQKEIARYTPHMTPALVNVVMNHPDRLEQVLKELELRGLPLNQADDLINDTVASSSAISEGAL